MSTGDMSAEEVNSKRNHASGIRERTRNGGFDAGIRRFDGLGKHRGDVAVAADQVLVKVPARNILGPRVRSPFVERMGVRALYNGFGGDRKGNPCFPVSPLGNSALSMVASLP